MRLFDAIGYKMNEVGCKLQMAKVNASDFRRNTVSNVIGGSMTFVGEKAHLLPNNNNNKKVNEVKKEEQKENNDLQWLQEIINDELKCWQNINANNAPKVIANIERKIKALNKPITVELQKQIQAVIQIKVIMNIIK